MKQTSTKTGFGRRSGDTLRHVARLTCRLVLFCGFTAGVGCLRFNHLVGRIDATAKPDERQAQGKSPYEVKVQGAGKLLDKDESHDGVSAEEFLCRANELLALGKKAEAQRWVRRYPDAALEVLRGTKADRASNPVLIEIAKVYDAQCHAGGNQQGWQAAFQDRSSRPTAYAPYDKVRRQVTEELKKAKPDAYGSVSIRSQLPADAPALLQMDALQIEALLLTQKGRFDEAKAALETALELSEKYLHQDVLLRLEYSDVLRRLGQHDEANEVWQETAREAAKLLDSAHSAHDPRLWNRCAYLRPVHMSWPEEVQQRLAEFNASRALTNVGRSAIAAYSSSKSGNPAAGESLVWAYIGHCRLHRHEPQTAVLALKQAEASALHPRFRDELQLAQAKAFVLLKQKEAAVANLARISSSRCREVAAAALAVLGTIKLQEGNPQQALALLHKSVEQNQSLNWPGRSDAEANLGLAYLMMGMEVKGLEWMHSAQKAFESTNDWSSLRQSLHNEIRYLENAGKQEQADAVRQRMLMVMSNGSN